MYNTFNYCLHGITNIFTNIMGSCIAVNIIPEIISGNWEKRVVKLVDNHAIFSLFIVRLTLAPVKPLDSLILVRPPPVTWIQSVAWVF